LTLGEEVKTHLFYTFLVIFAATAVITLLGVTNVIVIREGHLTALITAFLIELAGAVIAIFKSANFFSPEKSQISSEEKVWESIRKLDTAFGYAEDRLNTQAIHFHSRLLAAQHLGPTPRTDVMALVAQIEPLVGKIPASVIDEALGVIADILEKDVRIGSSEHATLISLCKRLPTEFSGSSSRLLNALEKRKA
jgi:hypothetical protein